MTMFLVVLNLIAGLLNALMYGWSGDFISLYCCIISTIMFFLLFAKEDEK